MGEQGKLADPQTVGEKANTCGTSSFNILTGKFNHDKFNSCFTASIGISSQCSECYAATGEYGASNCKADCLLGWCKSGCLSCTEPAQETLAACTGFKAGTASPCEELTATGACSADEQGKLADPQTVGERPTPAAPALSTSSLASSTTTSSTAASLHPLALAPVALSAMLQQVSMAPRTARLTASSAGASLAACPALSQRRRPLPHALDSKQAQPRHARS